MLSFFRPSVVTYVCKCFDLVCPLTIYDFVKKFVFVSFLLKSSAQQRSKEEGKHDSTLVLYLVCVQGTGVYDPDSYSKLQITML